MKTNSQKDVRNGLIVIAALIIMTVFITYNVVIFMGTVIKQPIELQK